MNTAYIKKVLDVEEAGAYLGLSHLTLANWSCRGGRGPKYVQLSSRKIGYRIEDLDEWLAERTFSSTTEADQATNGPSTC